MRLSLRNRSLLLLLALVATVGALTPPAAAQYCYFLEAQSCFYEGGGYCYFSCPSVSYCYGDVSGAPTCYPEGIVCCY